MQKEEKTEYQSNVEYKDRYVCFKGTIIYNDGQILVFIERHVQYIFINQLITSAYRIIYILFYFNNFLIVSCDTERKLCFIILQTQMNSLLLIIEFTN